MNSIVPDERFGGRGVVPNFSLLRAYLTLHNMYIKINRYKFIGYSSGPTETRSLLKKKIDFTPFIDF